MTKLKNYLDEEKAEKGDDKVLMAIMDFFADNPAPPDEEVHALGEKLGIEPDEFEAKIYSILGAILGTGKSKDEKFTEKDADAKELAMGIKVEMEHTNNKTISKRIALDHLAEIPDYYTRLKKMEGDAGIKD